MVAISYRTRRNILMGAVALLATVIVAALAATIFLPPKVKVPERPGASAAPKDMHQDRKAEPLSAYAVIWQRELRKPLFPPKDPAAVVSSASRPALALQLIGTAVESGHTFGLFIDRSGQVRTGSVGDTIEGAEIKSITDGAAIVKYFGSDVTLRVAKEGEAR